MEAIRNPIVMQAEFLTHHFTLLTGRIPAKLDTGPFRLDRPHAQCLTLIIS